MRKRIKNINLLLMWLIGLMFFTHAVIPHQHHFDSIYEHNQEAHITVNRMKKVRFTAMLLMI